MIQVRPLGALTTGIALVMVTCFLFATLDSLSKNLMLTMAAVQVLWGRYVVQTAAMTSYLAASSGMRFLRTRHPFLQIARGLAQATSNGLVYISLAHIPVGDVTAILYGSPIIVTVLSVIFLNERIGVHRIAAVIAGFIGVYLIIQPGSGETNFYHLLMLGAAFSNATYMLLTRRLAGPEEAAATQFNTTAVGLVIFTGIVLYDGALPPVDAMPLLLVVGLMGAAGHFCMVKALSYVPASMLSPYLYAQVMIAALYSVFWFGDALRPSMVLGTALLIASGIYIWWRERTAPTLALQATQR